MASNLWTLDNFKDFETIDKVFFSNNTDCYKNDDEGYTPLCFAALNGVSHENISYFMWKANGKSIFAKCNRGKTPLQYACMSMNTDTVDALINTSYQYDRLDSDGQPVYKKDEYGDVKLNSNGEPEWKLQNYIPWLTINNEIVYQLRKDDSTSKQTISTNGDMVLNVDEEYECAEADNPEILSASGLSTPDILNIFLEKKSPNPHTIAIASIKDNYGNTPLHLAVNAQCYQSIDLLLKKDSNPSTTIFAENDDGDSPFELAVKLGDTGIVSKFVDYYNGGMLTSIPAIEKVAEMQFAKLGELPEDDEILNKLFSCNYTFAVLGNDFTLLDGIHTTTLLDYYNNSTSKLTLASDLSTAFTDELCTNPADKTFGFIRPYIMFLQVIVAGKLTDTITAIYNRLENTRNADDNDPLYGWARLALSADGHDSKWTSKSVMIDSLENQIKSYIIEDNDKYKYIESDLFTGNTPEDYENNTHDVIPVNLWTLDYLITNNYSKCLKRILRAVVVTPTNQQKLRIKNAVIDGTLNYDLVIDYLPSVSSCINEKDYDYLIWLHNHSKLSNDDITLISTAVENLELNSANLTGWPWELQV